MADLTGLPSALRDVVERALSDIDNISALIDSDMITPDEWQREMQAAIDRFHREAAEAGLGDPDISQLDSTVARLVAIQFAFLENFANDIRGAEWIDSYRARAQMYGRAVSQAYWHANVIEQAGRVLPLPAMPAEGTQCLCITTPDSRVFTEFGYIPIGSILPGTFVLTHKLRWRRVLRAIITPASAHREVVIKMPGGSLVGCTSDHRWLTNEGWQPSINICNLGGIMYNIPYETLCKLRQNFKQSKRIRSVCTMPPDLPLWESERSSGRRMSILRETPISYKAVAKQESTGLKIEGPQSGGGLEAADLRGFDAKIFYDDEKGRPQVRFLLGGRSEALCLSVPLGMATSPWRHSAGVCNSSLKRRSERRPFREFGVNGSWPACKFAHDHRTYRTYGQNAHTSSLQQETSLDVSMVQDNICEIPAQWQFGPQILLPRLLPQGTPLYDIEVEQDHSFVLEGTITHNSNCKCSWRIVVVSTPRGDYDAFWVRHATDSCQTCLERERLWSPIRIRGGELL